jgi:hypothetical protein
MRIPVLQKHYKGSISPFRGVGGRHKNYKTINIEIKNSSIQLFVTIGLIFVFNLKNSAKVRTKSLFPMLK